MSEREPRKDPPEINLLRILFPLATGKNLGLDAEEQSLYKMLLPKNPTAKVEDLTAEVLNRLTEILSVSEDQLSAEERQPEESAADFAERLFKFRKTAASLKGKLEGVANN